MTVFGVQEPRFSVAPPSVVSTAAADDAIDLASAAGLVLDPWQQICVRLMLGQKADGDWAAFEFGFQAQRQNGKGGVLEARELGGLFLFGERDIIHSAHAADTSRKAFLRMRNLIDGAPFLSKRVRKIIGAPGREYIELMDRRLLEYRTRTASGGRGFSGTPVVLDEAQELTGEELAAIMPVVSAQANPQIVYAGTVKPGAAVFRGVIERIRKRLGDAFAGAEWSAAPDADSDDPEAHRQANPAMGYRPMTPGYVRNELAAFRTGMAEDKWRAERLGIWPDTDSEGAVIPLEAWLSRCVTSWRPGGDVSGGAVGVAVSMDRKYAAVGYAVPGDGRPFGEVVAQTDANRPGIDWVVPYLAGLQSRRAPLTVVADKAGPAFPLVNGMIAAGLPVQITEIQDWKSACAQFVDRVVSGTFAHAGGLVLNQSAQGVQRRDVGDGWVYNRKTPGVLVPPVEAVTLAVFGLVGKAKRPSKYETDDLLVL